MPDMFNDPHAIRSILRSMGSDYRNAERLHIRAGNEEEAKVCRETIEAIEVELEGSSQAKGLTQ